MSMELTKRLWEQPTDKGVLAYHIIQSFSPGEATPDQVHEIGCEFAQRFLADRFECTVSTHLDKGHLHNVRPDRAMRKAVCVPTSKQMLPRCRKNYGKQNLPHRKNEMR